MPVSLRQSLARETSKTRLVASNGVEAYRVLPISAKQGKLELHRER